MKYPEITNGPPLYVEGKGFWKRLLKKGTQREEDLRAFVREALAWAFVRWNIKKAPIEPLRSNTCQ